MILQRQIRTWHVGMFLAFRSLVRGNIGTSIMTVFMMAMIFMNLIFLTSIINGLTQTANRQIVQTLAGEVLVEPSAGQTYIDNANTVENQLKLVSGVVDVTARTNFSAELELAGKKGSYRGIAINPDDEAAVTVVDDHIVSGRFLRPDDTDAIIIGVQIAGGKTVDDAVEMQAYSLQGAQVGDTVTMRYSNGYQKEYHVVGIFDTNFVQGDNRFFMTQHEYNGLFPEVSHKASEFAVKIRQTANVNTVAADMKELGIEYSVRTWEETAGIVESFTASFDVVNFIVSAAALLVAGITIFIVMYIDVVNRKRQIGILRAIGIAEMSIAISYLVRALLYALLGVALGILIFKYGISPIFVRKPLHLPVGDVSLVVELSVLYVRGLALFLVAFLGAYIPIQRILRMRIINAIWGD